MSADSLQASQQRAAELLGVNYWKFLELQQPSITRLGTIKLSGGRAFGAYRAHSGAANLIGKGGIRFAAYDPEVGRETIDELSREMSAKLALRGYNDRFRGAKGLVLVDARSLSHEDKIAVMRQFTQLMDKAGFADWQRDIPAGDIGTNGLIDVYADEYAKLHPDDVHKRAVITGKSPAAGGLDFRVAATGWGVYTAHTALLEQRGIGHATVSVQGFGTVGSWYTYFASQDIKKTVAIRALSDGDGMLSTDHPAGLIITKRMVDEIGSNLDFTGGKMHELAKWIGQNQPELKGHLQISDNPDDILSQPVDYFVPAAFGNVIKESNVHLLGATRGIVEAANGPTTAAAHKLLIERGFDVLPDIVANGAGVSCSIMEYDANVAVAEGRPARTTTAHIKAALAEDSRRLVDELFAVCDRYEVTDLREAAAILGMQAVAKQHEALVVNR